MKYFNALLLTLLFNISFSQNAYNDALAMKKMLNADGVFQVTSSPENDLIWKRIQSFYLINSGTSNPFLEEFIEGAGQSVEEQTLLKSSSGNFLSSLDVTKYANALASLMIDRAKQELTITFFNRFKKFVEENPEAGILFPKTTDNLVNLLTYKYPEMLPALRVSFFEDISKIAYTLDDVLALPRYEQLLAKVPEVKIVLRSLRLAQEIISGATHPADAFTDFAAFPEWKDTSLINWGSSVKLADIFSQSLRKVDTIYLRPQISLISDTPVFKVDTVPIIDTVYLKMDTQYVKVDTVLIKIDTIKNREAGDKIDTKLVTVKKGDVFLKAEIDSIKIDTIAHKLVQTSTVKVRILENIIESHFDSSQAWVSAKEIKELIKDTITFKIYLGLIYQLAAKEDIYWKIGDSAVHFTTLLAKYKDHPIVLENKVSGFITLAEQTSSAYKEIKQKKDSGISLTKDDYYNYVNTSLDMLEYGFGIARNFNDSFSLPEYDYVKTLRKINNLYRHTFKEDYTQVVTDAVGILTDIEEKTKWSQGDSGKPYKKLSLVIPKIAKYGTFMANVADAKTSEDVKAALDNAILPVGSSAIKKYARWNLSVQSYLGAFLRFGKKDMNAGYAWTDRWGVSAPIGISLSHGFSQCGSLSLFASLIDLGAIVDYQLKVDSVINSNGDKVPAISKDYKIKLGQLFSPGGYLVYGFGGNIPLAFGLGAQYGPGLSKIDTDAGTPVVLNPKWRFNAFLSVDLPFFNLLNSTKKRK
ncbi:hypothetical protein [Agriterribacter sp.]|uniref:hypothetical protein n=1 Tax=Agriterribacter sp. TaxID=2821509 RepID=UPI002B7E3B65|nr:hypothetical protein [Agriterribacter sp.]HTN05384.1 hypothetical protein [Agriterribacter sp.]